MEEEALINYKSVLFKTDSGREPVTDWMVDNFKKQEREEINTDILFVAEYFPNVPKSGMVRKISGYEDIWEIRIRFANKTQIRIFFLEHNSDLVILHGFIKKTQKTPKKILKLVQRRKQAYLNRGGDNHD